MELKFEWDEKKNVINISKHGISFEEAAVVFSDQKRYEIYDKVHSFFEKRWKTVGLSGIKLLRVTFTERNDKIRIISARKADKNDTKEYFYGYGAKNN